MICLMVGNTVGMLAVTEAHSYGIKSIVAYDNQKLYQKLGYRVYDTIYDERFITDLQSNTLLCVHGREIVPLHLLRKTRYAINVHPYFNYYKGKSPIKRAIEENNSDADVTAHYMTENVDEGGVLFQEKVLIENIKNKSEMVVYSELYHLYVKAVRLTLKYLQTEDKNIFSVV